MQKQIEKVSLLKFDFYLPQMEYEGSIGLVSRKKYFRTSGAVDVERKICATPTASPLKARELKFRLPESFGPT
jgi:hypothetical protein